MSKRSLYKNEFDKLLSKGVPAKSFLLWGAEPYYIQKYGERLRRLLDAGENSLVHYYDEYDFEQAKNYLSQASLFGDLNCYRLKTDKVLPAKELKALLDICHKTPNSYFIYELHSNDGNKIHTYFLQRDDATAVRFFEPKEHEAMSELRQIAQEKGVKIDEASLLHLLRLVEGKLSLAAKELEKLAIFEEVGTKEIDRLVHSLAPLSMEKLYRAILAKEPLGVLLQKIEEEDIEVMPILLGFQRYLKELFLFYSSIRLHGKADSKAILGYKLPSFVEEERVRSCMRIKNYPEIFLTLQECEHALKTKTQIDQKTLLYSCLMKIQALI
jgi:DNA polymerase-3 subunit delta